MVVQKEIHNLIKELAKKHGLSIQATREIVISQFTYLKEEMGKGEHDNYPTFKHILLKHLGTFYASEGKIKHIIKRKEERDGK